MQSTNGIWTSTTSLENSIIEIFTIYSGTVRPNGNIAIIAVLKTVVHGSFMMHLQSFAVINGMHKSLLEPQGEGAVVTRIDVAHSTIAYQVFIVKPVTITISLEQTRFEKRQKKLFTAVDDSRVVSIRNSANSIPVRATEICQRRVKNAMA